MRHYNVYLEVDGNLTMILIHNATIMNMIKVMNATTATAVLTDVNKKYR